jgi:nucleoside-diphosphate-sugar epimerase
MTGETYVILGCGFTGSRVARALAGRGERVVATTRRPDPTAIPGVDFLRASDLDQVPGALRVLHSVPLAQDGDGRYFDPTPALLAPLRGRVARMVYLSTTGVYGAAFEVDERTPVAPRSPRERLRVDAEDAVESCADSSMVLRPAAIYGPGRGVHVSIAQGTFLLLGDGANYISRIHVDDLAGLALTALDLSLTGRFPVADLHPCPSREIAEFCAGLLGAPMPASASQDQLSETRRNNRKVNGQAVLRALGYELKYPSYLQGVPASL